MHKPFVASLLLAVCLGSARADPYTAHFDEARDKVVAMRDALVEPLTRQEMKRKALLEKILVAFDRVSVSLATDVKTGKAVAAVVAKGFADDPDLPAVILELLTNLEGDVRQRVQGLISRLAVLPDVKLTRKAKRLVAKAQSPLSAADDAALAGNLKKLAGALTKATTVAATLESALRRAESAAGIQCPGPHGIVTATVDGSPFVVDPARIAVRVHLACPTSSYYEEIYNISVEFFQEVETPLGPFADPRIGLSFDNDSASGLVFRGADVYPTGPREVARGGVRLQGENDTGSVSGTVTLTTFDLAGQRMTGTAEFVATNSFPGDTHTVSMQFDVTCFEITQLCNAAK